MFHIWGTATYVDRTYIFLFGAATQDRVRFRTSKTNLSTPTHLQIVLHAFPIVFEPWSALKAIKIWERISSEHHTRIS